MLLAEKRQLFFGVVRLAACDPLLVWLLSGSLCQPSVRGDARPLGRFF